MGKRAPLQMRACHLRAPSSFPRQKPKITASSLTLPVFNPPKE
jgi:hypothetical protein